MKTYTVQVLRTIANPVSIKGTGSSIEVLDDDGSKSLTVTLMPTKVILELVMTGATSEEKVAAVAVPDKFRSRR